MDKWFSESLYSKIKYDYENAMEKYPQIKEDVDIFLSDLKGEAEQACMRFLYAFMPIQDIIDYRPNTIFQYVRAGILARKTISYAAQVPIEIFLSYVLPARINNENLDESRMAFYQELLPRVNGKSISDAILEVNYWCYEKATYTPSDDRTLAPSALLRSARGRCGEESTLAACALRSVGIPARQCYVPRWAHCDDNHAWVEVWADGKWHYIGACEPEPVLDKGWFTAAASKAMLVQSKAFSNLLYGEQVLKTTPVYSLVNSLDVYAAYRKITVHARQGKRPLPGVTVRFEIINYAELYPLYSAKTDLEGKAVFSTGYGDLYIYAYLQSDDTASPVIRTMSCKLGHCDENTVVFDFAESTVLMETPAPSCPSSGVCTEVFDMLPPKEHVVPAKERPAAALLKLHTDRLAECDHIREVREAGFPSHPDSGGQSLLSYISPAKGNAAELETFFHTERFSLEDKLQILSTLRDKDFVDITSDTLTDCMESSLPYKNKYTSQIYSACLLAPRISDEMLRPVRKDIIDFIQNSNLHFDNPVQIWNYLLDTVKTVDENDCDNLISVSAWMLRYGYCGLHSFPILFIAVCRSLGFAARLNETNGSPEYIWTIETGEAVFLSPCRDTDPQTDLLKLTLQNGSGRPMLYGIHYTIGHLENGTFRTLKYQDEILNGSTTYSLLPGYYRIITAIRQIDGSISACTYSFWLQTDCLQEIALREDETAEKLMSVTIGDTALLDLNGSRTTLYRECGSGNTVLIFASPGKEPTEHLFQELLEEKNAYNKDNINIIILIPKAEDQRNRTLQSVLRELDGAGLFLYEEEDYLFRLHQAMQVGDERLPFAIALGQGQKGLFAFANYNIGTAHIILNIYANTK